MHHYLRKHAYKTVALLGLLVIAACGSSPSKVSSVPSSGWQVVAEAVGGSPEANSSGTVYYSVLAQQGQSSADPVTTYAGYLESLGYGVRNIGGRTGFPVAATKGRFTYYIGRFSDYVRTYSSFLSEKVTIQKLQNESKQYDASSLIIVEKSA